MEEIESLLYIEIDSIFVSVPKTTNVAPIINPVENSAERNSEAGLTVYEAGRVPDLEVALGTTTLAEMNLILRMIKKKPFRVKWYNLEAGSYYISDYYSNGIRYSIKPNKKQCNEVTFNLIAYEDVEKGRYNE